MLFWTAYIEIFFPELSCHTGFQNYPVTLDRIDSALCLGFNALFSGRGNLRTRTNMLAHVLQMFLGKTPCKKLAALHPRQGNLLQKNKFSAVYKTSLHFTN
jgi:hypothetical protein